MTPRDVGLLIVATFGGMFFGMWQQNAAAGSWMVLFIIAIGDAK